MLPPCYLFPVINTSFLLQRFIFIILKNKLFILLGNCFFILAAIIDFCIFGFSFCIVFQDGSIFLFDLATNEVIQTSKKAHSAAIWQLVTTPDRVRTFASSFCLLVLFFFSSILFYFLVKVPLFQPKLFVLPICLCYF